MIPSIPQEILDLVETMPPTTVIHTGNGDEIDHTILMREVEKLMQEATK
jgi:hypothetical protein